MRWQAGGAGSAGLLAVDAGVSDDAIAASVGVRGSTVYRTKRRFVEGSRACRLPERRFSRQWWGRTPGRGKPLSRRHVMLP